MTAGTRKVAVVGVSLSDCGRVDDEGYGNTVEVTPAAGVSLDLERVTSARRRRTW